MTECRSEGELRAYIDHELPAEELGRIHAHVAECAECSRVVSEMNGRAMWVGEMMGSLAVSDVAQRRARRIEWRWVAAAGALAAGIAIGIAMREWDRPRGLSSAGRQAQATEAPAPLVVEAPRPPAVESAAVSPPRRVRRPVRRPAAPRNEFVALDDEPFDTGVVVRMALGPKEVPADVLFGPDGRAHGIRLVNYK